MNSKELQTFAYSKVEAALCKVFDARGDGLSSLRGRLKSFQRSGLTPETPGRGKVIRYNMSNIYDWALALTLADFGVTPDKITKLVLPGDFLNSIEIYRETGKDVYLCIAPRSFSGLDFVFSLKTTSDDIVPEKLLSEWAGFACAIINLSQLKARVDQAID